VPGVDEASIEYGTDTTRTIASLVFSGAAARYADIEFIFSHAGGTMPFLIERFDVLARSPGWLTDFLARQSGALPMPWKACRLSWRIAP
jgi:hypothetical protein